MILESEDDLEVVGEAVDGLQAVFCGPRAAARRRTDGHPDARARRHRATRRLTAHGEPAKVLILTTFDLDEYVFDALRAGASGSCSRTRRPASSPPPYG